MVNVQFQNPEGSQTVKVYWLSFDKKEILYHTMGPGQQVNQGTGHGHEWIVRNAETNKLIGKYVAQEYETTFIFPKVKRQSLPLHTNIPVVFKSQSQSSEVKIYWIDFSGEEKLYKTLAPGESWGISTYVGHQWVIRDSKTEKFVMQISGTQKDQEIIVPKDSIDDMKLDSQNNYDYKTMEYQDIQIHYTQDVMDDNGQKWIDFMENSIDFIHDTVPEHVWDEMKTIDVYVNNEFYWNGEEKGGAVVHWSAGWLENNGNLVEKEGHVEIHNIGSAMTWADESLLMHEFAHAYQWRQGDYGSEVNQMIEDVYNKAIADGKYLNVQNRWGNYEKHYAATNSKEYFAEISVAFFYHNERKHNRYPFNYEDLKAYDPEGFELLSKVYGIENPDQYFACLYKRDECEAPQPVEDEEDTLRINVPVTFQGSRSQIEKIFGELEDGEQSFGLDLSRLPNFQTEEQIMADFNINASLGSEWFMLDSSSAPSSMLMLP